MAGRKKKQGLHQYGSEHDHSDSVSELSHDDSSVASNFSKTSNKFGRTIRGKFTRKKKGAGVGGTDGTSSVGSSSRASKASKKGRAGAASAGAAAPGGASEKRTPRAANTSRAAAGSSVDGSTGRRPRGRGGMSEQKRLEKDAKSRFNIGLVYLKTGDYAKAQDNLEHSLYCHIQLHGHDAKTYDNDVLCAIAGVREKLGDCYLGNEAQVDKVLALDHFEEAGRLLKSVDAEDAGDNVKEMLERVEEKLADPQLNSPEVKRQASRAAGAAAANRKKGTTRKYEMEGNDKARKMLGIGVAAGGVAATSAAVANGRNNAKPPPSSNNARYQPRNTTASRSRSPRGRTSQTSQIEKIDILGVGRGFKKISHFVGDGFHEVAEKIGLEESSDSGRSSLSGSGHGRDADDFAVAMSHLERDNHRTALNYLTSLMDGGAMKHDDFRTGMGSSLMRIADSALGAGKNSVATDAYEDAYAIYKQDEGDGGPNMKLAMRGCIKGNKLLAQEAESLRSYGPAIQHRTRVCALLDENVKTIPACQQEIKIAYLHGEKEDYAKAAVTLQEARRRVYKGIRSIDMMPKDRMALLIQIHAMLAICYAKQEAWNDAMKQYDELMPLVAKTQGQGGRQYNSALIHKAALLVTMGNHRLAASTVDKYLKLAELAGEDRSGKLIVDDMDHLLALDTCAATHLKMGNTDKAIVMFQKKLAFVKTLPDGNKDETKKIRSDTMHRLGCLLAYENQYQTALPLLNEALNTRKVLSDGMDRSVFETTWAVAATNHTLGDNDKALKDYALLLEKMKKIDDLPVHSVVIHNSAGKLFYEGGEHDSAVRSFRQALKESAMGGNSKMKAEISLNLANALSARGEVEEAMELYDIILKNKSLKKSKMFFTTLVNKAQLLIKMGEVDEAKEILHKIADTRSSMASDVKGSINLTLGNLAVRDGKIDEAIEYYEKAIDAADDDDAIAQAKAKTQIGLAYMVGKQDDRAIETLEDVLEDLSHIIGLEEGSNKQVELLKAEVWNSMSRVYKKKNDLAQAKNFAKLALRTFKSQLGENNPITLRNVSNLQLLLLEEAEALDKPNAKPIIDAAKYELEATLDAFESLNDSYTYRLDVASLKTNLGFVAVWQGKPKKARKLVRQIEEIELPPEHSLIHMVEVLEQRVDELEKKKTK